MARDRQRAKQRQAERRARRLADQPDGGTKPERSQARAAEPAIDEPTASDGAPDPELAPGIDPNLAVGAPPQDEGHSETVVEDEPELEDDDEHLLDEELEAEREAEEEDEAYAPRGRRGRDTDAHAKDRSRLVQFLMASWAELQRVQWPNRQALTTLTGIVLGFVLIAGGFLGLMDAIVSRIINAIL
jgi:preprotein translocase subunit SecE